MKILVVNAGSSSIKFQFIDTKTKDLLAKGTIYRIGENLGDDDNLIYKANGNTYETKKKIATFGEGVKAIMSLLTDKNIGVIKNFSQIDAVGHRIVQGAELFKKSTLITPKVVEQIESIAQSMNMPSSITGRFQGQAEAFQSSMKGMGMLLILCVLIIYIILGILYESFIHPLTILSGLPAAGFGALITLMLFGLDLNIYGFVGLIMLVGIVKKNAIMIIDFALEAQRSGSSPEEAIFKGCILRFRPIMMTTLAAITGALPIAFGYGAGGEARQPLGLSVTGGLLVSQVITLYITPVIYLYFEDLRNWISVHWNREKRKELVSLSQTASMK